jgi:hypothetical protein
VTSSMAAKPKTTGTGRSGHGSASSGTTSTVGRIPGAIVTMGARNTVNDELIAAAMKASLAKMGYINMRIQPSVYDPDKKYYVNLLGRQARIKVFAADTVNDIMRRIEDALQNGQNGHAHGGKK